jgi:hypothetical protein
MSKDFFLLLFLSFCDHSNQLIPVSIGRWVGIYHGSSRSMISTLSTQWTNAQKPRGVRCRCMDTNLHLENRNSWQVKEWNNRYRLDLRFDGKCYSGFHSWNIQHANRTIHSKVQRKVQVRRQFYLTSYLLEFSLFCLKRGFAGAENAAGGVACIYAGSR